MKITHDLCHCGDVKSVTANQCMRCYRHKTRHKGRKGEFPEHDMWARFYGIPRLTFRRNFPNINIFLALQPEARALMLSLAGKKAK